MASKLEWAKQQRAADKPTIPSTIKVCLTCMPSAARAARSSEPCHLGAWTVALWDVFATRLLQWHFWTHLASPQSWHGATELHGELSKACAWLITQRPFWRRAIRLWSVKA